VTRTLFVIEILVRSPKTQKTHRAMAALLDRAMAALLDRTPSSHEVCAFENYEALEAGRSREYIPSNVLAPSAATRKPGATQHDDEEVSSCGRHKNLPPPAEPWVLCQLERPEKDQFYLFEDRRSTGRCDDYSFLLSAKKIGEEFYISTYEPESSESWTPDDPTSPTSPKANYAAVLAPSRLANGRPVAYRLQLCSGVPNSGAPRRKEVWGANNNNSVASANEAMIEVGIQSHLCKASQVELRQLRITMPKWPAGGEIPAHYVHDCASPTRLRPSHPGFLRENDVSGVVTLSNKLPKWNHKLRCLSLHFGRKRVVESSSKNFLVYTDDVLHDRRRAESADHAVFQLGKLDSRIFALDFRYPLSPIQAFAIALTAFTAKNARSQ